MRLLSHLQGGPKYSLAHNITHYKMAFVELGHLQLNWPSCLYKLAKMLSVCFSRCLSGR